MTGAEFKSALRLLLCSLLLLILTRISGSRLPEMDEAGALSLRLRTLEARKIRSLRREMRLPEGGEAGALSLRLCTLDARIIRALRAAELIDRGDEPSNSVCRPWVNSISLSGDELLSLDPDVSEKLLLEQKLSWSDSLYIWLSLAFDIPIEHRILIKSTSYCI